jgi:hypothetical protein
MHTELEAAGRSIVAERIVPAAPLAQVEARASAIRTRAHRRRTASIAAASLIAIAIVAIVVRSAKPAERAVVVHGSGSRSNSALQSLFTRTAPNGITIYASVGRVPIAAASECRVVPVPSPGTALCPTGNTDGVQFDYASGAHHYRVTVLDNQLPRGDGPLLQPMTTAALVREVRPNGTTVLAAGSPTAATVLYSRRVTSVSVRVLTRGGTSSYVDTMVPVLGWTAFPIPFTSEARDVQARTVDGTTTNALPFRCC